MSPAVRIPIAVALSLLATTCCRAPRTPVAAPPAAPEPVPACEGEPLCWFHDDYPAALAEARRRDVPLVVDIWAPWCHTCLSMKHEVLADPSMAAVAERFVWLAIDTDRPENAAALEKLPVSAWPTFYVVSPVDGSIQARYVGAASLAQVRELLATGEAGHLDAAAAGGTLAASDPLFALRAAERAAAAGDLARADELYGQALAAAPPDWPRRADALVSRIAARAKQDRYAECSELGLAEMDNTGRSASAGDFTYWAVSCAGQLESGDLLREQLQMRAFERLQQLADDESAPLAADDRSDVLRLLRNLQHDMGDRDSARATAERQRALLDSAAEAASSPEAASTFNWPRAEVYVYLGRGAEILPALERSAVELNDDYDPPYRVAWVALKIGQLDRALEAAQHSLELVYGPRRGRVLSLIADIHHERGDSAAERDFREQTVAHYESLPAGQRSPRSEQAARDALATLDNPEPAPSAAIEEPAVPPMSERERKRAIRKLSRKFKKLSPDAEDLETIVARYATFADLMELDPIENGATKHEVRKLLGKPDWVATDEPRHEDIQADVEWVYTSNEVCGYYFGFTDGAVVYHIEHCDDPNPP